MATDDIDSESDHESLLGSEGALDVQLGFVEEEPNPLFLSADWSQWDGGIIGGCPRWLDPVNLPSTKAVQCRLCEQPMRFLLQIYCPLDDVDAAFHRCLYLMCCKNASCVSKGSVICLRSQLPRSNAFYGFKSGTNPAGCDDRGREQPNRCALCGFKADLKCSRCKNTHYCSKTHQKSHWQTHKLKCGVQAENENGSVETTAVISSGEDVCDASSMRHLYPRYSLAVCAEDFEGAGEEDKKAVEHVVEWEEDESNPKEGGRDVAGEVGAGSSAGAEGADAADDPDTEEDPDAALTQAKYNAALGNALPDAEYNRFLTRVRKGGADQVIRYSRWPEAENSTDGRLWISDDAKDAYESKRVQIISSINENGSDGGVPSLCMRPSDSTGSAGSSADAFERVCRCDHCGAPREFEFQVMPQLLYYLNVDRKTCVKPQTPDPAAEAPSSSSQQEVRFTNDSDEDIDWGTLDVYTCTASCPGSSASSQCDGSYIEECVVVVPVPRASLHTGRKPTAANTAAAVAAAKMDTSADKQDELRQALEKTKLDTIDEEAHN